MLKSQDSRMIVVFTAAVVFFLVALGRGVVTDGTVTLWEYLKVVMMSLATFCVLVIAVIWAVRGD